MRLCFGFGVWEGLRVGYCVLQLVVRSRASHTKCFFVLCGDSYAGVFPSHLGVVGVVGFLVWAVFLFALGWGKRFFCPIRYMALCWVGWDEDGEVCCVLAVFCCFFLRVAKKYATLRSRL